MKKLSILFTACLLIGCESTGFAPPPVTAQMATTSAKQRVDLATLREGRTLFTSRCIECHTLPPVSRYTAEEWPCLVNEMEKRANLKSSEHDAVLAYILAARQL